MKNVHFKRGRANFARVLRTTDLDRLGIKHKGENLIWNSENRFMLVMNNQMSDSLVERFPDDFYVTDVDGDDEAPEVPAPMTSLASSGTGSVEDSPDESETSGNDDRRASTSSKSKNR